MTKRLEMREKTFLRYVKDKFALKNKKRLLVSAFFITIFQSVPSFADDEYQNLQILGQLAYDKIIKKIADQQEYDKIVVKVNAPDNRLKLAPCSTNIDANFPSDFISKRLTIQLSCSAPQSWSIYLIAEIGLYKEVIVFSEHLTKGRLIQDSDLKTDLVDVNDIRESYYKEKSAIIGKELKRNIKSGEIVREVLLNMPQVIKRGQLVSLMAVSSAISVETTGTAMSDGRIGDIIRVKNNRSERIVSGIVQPNGEVYINF